MPSWVDTASEEKAWKEAKKVVSEERNKTEDEFTDRDWGLVTHIAKQSKSKGAFHMYQPRTIQEARILLQAGLDEDYDAFFKKKLETYGVSGPDDLSEEDKKKFFSEVEVEWEEGKGPTEAQKTEAAVRNASPGMLDTLSGSVDLVLPDFVKPGKEEEVLSAFEKSLSLLKQSGARLTKIDPSDPFVYAILSYKGLTFSMSARDLAMTDDIKAAVRFLPEIAEIARDAEKDIFRDSIHGRLKALMKSSRGLSVAVGIGSSMIRNRGISIWSSALVDRASKLPNPRA